MNTFSRENWLKSMAAILLSTVLFGQLFRVEIFAGSTGGLLISDFVVLAFATVFALMMLVGRVALPKAPFMRWFFLWVAILLLAYLIHFWRYEPRETVVAFGYLIRLLAYYSLLLAGFLLFLPVKVAVVRYLGYLSFILLVLGALILAILPDFSVLAPLGWDPHVGRLTSTWLDPNYFGCFLAILFGYFLAFSGKVKDSYSRFYPVFVLFLILLWAGIYLTYSRSALLTFLIAGLAVAVQMSWRTSLFVLALFVLTFAFPSRLQQRVSQGINFSVQQGSGEVDRAEQTDPSSNFRLQSWKRAIAIFTSDPVLGVGYNFYPQQQERQQLLSAEQIQNTRGTSGSDSSLLTFLATTGVVGTGVFLAFWGSIVRELWRRRSNPFCLGSIGMVAGWFASSFLNNTLLYVHMLLPFLLMIGISLAVAHGRRDS